jgi:hypothetical protein
MSEGHVWICPERAMGQGSFYFVQSPMLDVMRESLVTQVQNVPFRSQDMKTCGLRLRRKGIKNMRHTIRRPAQDSYRA